MDDHRFTIGQKSEEKPLELKFYHRYQHIKQRCVNPKNPAYKNYGGKGIDFSWGTFKDFKNDMWESFKEHVASHGERDTTIERKDTSLPYCKENCRWATRKEQRRNSSQNVFLEYLGERLPLITIAEKSGMRYRVLVKRISAGWTLERALSRPITKNRWIK